MKKHRRQVDTKIKYFEPPRRLIGNQSGRCSEAEYIAMKMLAQSPPQKREAKPVTIRKFSWEA